MRSRADIATRIPTALDRYLDSLGAAGQRVRDTLQDLGGLGGAGDKSPLTPTGAPIEFGFSEAAADLRYTVEIGPPDPSCRLSWLRRLIAARDLFPATALLDQLQQDHQSQALRYGAWLGLRHDQHGDRFKIYAEVPQIAAPRIDAKVTAALGAPFRSPGPAPLPRMLGVDADATRFEVYYALTDVLRSAVPALLERAGFGAGADAMLALIDSMSVFSPGPRLPGRDLGVSYALSSDGRADSVTLYLVAKKLFRDDAAVATWLDGRLPDHDGLMRHVPSGKGMHHGMIGLTLVAGASRPILSVGVAAPWEG